MTFSIEKSQHDSYSTQINFMEPLKSKIINFSKKYLQDVIKLETEPHCTILFGIKDKEVKDKISSTFCSGILGEIKKFSQPEQDVIYIEVFSSDVHNKHNYIKNNFKVNLTHPKYTPHVTLGYCKKGSNDNLLQNKTFYGDKFQDLEILFCGKDEQKYKLPSIIRKI